MSIRVRAMTKAMSSPIRSIPPPSLNSVHTIFPMPQFLLSAYGKSRNLNYNKCIYRNNFNYNFIVRKKWLLELVKFINTISTTTRCVVFCGAAYFSKFLTITMLTEWNQKRKHKAYGFSYCMCICKCLDRMVHVSFHFLH